MQKTIMLALLLACGAITGLSSCSKSPTDTAIDAGNTVSNKLLDPLVLKDASAQAERMVANLSDKPQVRDLQDADARSRQRFAV